MSDYDPSKKISAAAIQALKEALTCAYWYKSDLRSFLNHTISEPAILSRVSWDEYKRNIVTSVVDYLAKNEDVYQRHLLRLMTETAKINDLSHLAKLDDGKRKVLEAQFHSTRFVNKFKDTSTSLRKRKSSRNDALSRMIV
jgi:phenylacetate-coenzyme A ligase PaaK-like adenylate-forming protein